MKAEDGVEEKDVQESDGRFSRRAFRAFSRSQQIGGLLIIALLIALLLYRSI
ncbi:MAG TPA: hypothetical protein VJH03_18205 [Blastocatellia bacterium]|nr:hypothetical protein [Blastocatellia bacterium]